jgi:hypothetical protein
MQKLTLFSKPIQLGLIAISLFAVACNSKKEEKTMTNESNNTNPLVQKWEDRYNGIPPFDKVKIEDFIPAEEMAIAEQRAEIKLITSNTAAPTFENTVEAMEKTGVEALQEKELKPCITYGSQVWALQRLTLSKKF